MPWRILSRHSLRPSESMMDAYSCLASRALERPSPSLHSRDAIARRLDDPSMPLPLLGVCATWSWGSDRPRTILDWLVAGSPRLDPQTAKVAVQTGNAIVILDGLDELGEQQFEELVRVDGGSVKALFDPRARFLMLFNREISTRVQLVISCRSREFRAMTRRVAKRETLGGPLEPVTLEDIQIPLSGAVALRPLTDDQIDQYLTDKGELLRAVRADDELREMLRTPLVISIFAFAFGDSNGAEAIDFAGTGGAATRDAIIGAYVVRRFEWEERKSRLRYSLAQFYGVLGRAAVWDAGEGGKVVSGIRLQKSMVEQGKRLHILVGANRKTTRFIHLLVRDHFALRGAEIVRSDPDEQLRAAAARTLGRSGHPTSASLLVDLLGDPSPVVAYIASRAFWQLDQAGNRELVVRALMMALESTNQKVVSGALGAIAHPEYLEFFDAILPFLARDDWRMQASAVWALERVGGKRAVPKIAPLAGSPHGIVREAVRAALVRLQSDTNRYYD